MPHASDSTGVIPKSSSTGIKIVAIDSQISFLNSGSVGDSTILILGCHSIIFAILSFSGSFLPCEIISFLSGISIKAWAILSTLLISVRRAQLK